MKQQIICVKFSSALGHICSEITWKGILKMLNGQIVQHFSQLSIFSLSSLKEITLYLPNIGWFKSYKGLSVQNKQNIWTLFSPDNAEIENLIKDIWEMVIWLNLRLNFLQNNPNTSGIPKEHKFQSEEQIHLMHRGCCCHSGMISWKYWNFRKDGTSSNFETHRSVADTFLPVEWLFVGGKEKKLYQCFRKGNNLFNITLFWAFCCQFSVVCCHLIQDCQIIKILKQLLGHIVI